MQQGNLIDIFLARHVSGYISPSSGGFDELQHMVFCTDFLDGWWSSEPLRRPPPIQKLGAENHMLQLNI